MVKRATRLIQSLATINDATCYQVKARLFFRIQDQSKLNLRGTLICKTVAQRLALPAWGGRVDSPSKRDTAEAKKKLEKRGAYPKSGARIVRRFLFEVSSILEIAKQRYSARKANNWLLSPKYTIRKFSSSSYANW